jgi:3,4-dihydroxy 2-butanone 4-phosphate synthase/GTP cyclohydrolase II
MDDLLSRISKFSLREERPFVTLTYAQSLDGCIAARRGKPLALSGQQSLTFTHRMRALHDAILVGIGTVLADNPRLTVRLVTGKNPQPIVLDSRLRFPLDTNLLKDQSRSPWIATGEGVGTDRVRALETAGARVLRFPIDGKGHVDLAVLLRFLVEQGMHRLMVEGGAHVITSFLSHRLIDRLVLTVTPFLVGGLRAFDPLGDDDGSCFPRLRNVGSQWLGEDIILWGEPIWEDR